LLANPFIELGLFLVVLSMIFLAMRPISAFLPFESATCALSLLDGIHASSS